MQVELAHLWQPILLSTAVVFIASAIVWMVLPIHKNDYKKLKDEAAMLGAVRAQGLAAGLYMFPACDPATLKSDPSAMERYNAGPWGVLTIAAKKWSMGYSLPMWALYLLIVNVFIAYIASVALPAGSAYLRVFQLVGAACFLPYVVACIPMSIWESKPWRFTFGHIFDGVIYSLLTAGLFGWLWPKALAAAPAVPGLGG